MKSYILGSCYSLECSLCRLTSSPRLRWWAWSTNILTCFHTSNTQGQGNGDLVGRSWREAYQEVNNLRIVCDNAITFNVHFLSFLIFSGWGWQKVWQVIQSNLTIHYSVNQKCQFIRYKYLHFWPNNQGYGCNDMVLISV